MKKSYLIIGIILLIFLAIGCSGNNNGSDNTQTATPEQTTTVKAPEVKAEPVVIANWQGESIKDTETFSVPTDEWKITWDTTEGKMGPMAFQIYVYKAGENQIPVSVAANVIGANHDSTVIRGAGDYYLKINTGQPYNITVETI